jgi:2-iminobutanoate/2-iminopropanoate deaminase
LPGSGSLDNVVMVHAINSGFYNAVNLVYAKYFSVNPPARGFVPVASWPMDFDIEIECVAVA